MNQSLLSSVLALGLLLVSCLIISGCVGLKLAPFYDSAVLQGADGGQVKYLAEAPIQLDSGNSFFNYLEERTPANCFWMLGTRSRAIDERLFLCCSADSGPVCKEAEWYEKKRGPGLQ